MVTDENIIAGIRETQRIAVTYSGTGKLRGNSQYIECFYRCEQFRNLRKSISHLLFELRFPGE